MKLTNQTISSSSSDNSKRPLRDGRGLELRTSQSGHRSWSLLYWFAGKKYRYTIGSYPAVTLKHARQIADGLRAQLADGTNPQLIKKAAAAEADLTISYCYEDFLVRHLRAKLKSWREYDRAMRKDFLARFEKRPITAVNKNDLIKMLDQIKGRGASIHANRVLQYVKRFFGWCVEMDYIDANPAHTIPKPSKEAVRDHVLSLDELQKIYVSADGLGKVHAVFVKLLILTGHRRSELSNLKWQEIEDGLLRLSAERSKNSRPIVTPLTERMSGLLGELARGDGEFVFSTTGGARPISGFSKMKKQLDEVCEITDWRLHDFRRSLATTLEELDFDRFSVKCVLNHTDTSVTAVYDRSLHVRRKLKALMAWESNLFDRDNIVLLRQTK